MVLNQDGRTLVARIAVAVVVSLVALVFRILVGPGKRRGRVMLLGMLGGLSVGVLSASVVSRWLNVETSVICACIGMMLGWCAAWPFARQIPREAS